jgi:hypothetical protein
MAEPRRMRSVINQMPFLNTPDLDVNLARATQLAGILGTAKEAKDRYSALVNAQTDLQDRIGHILGGRFTGYIPPRTDGYGQYNSSPIRAALVEIVTEALTRANDWRHYDSDRLGTVPARHIRAPWTERRDLPPPQQGEALWHESDQ